MHGHGFDDGCEGVGIVEARYLHVALSDDVSFKVWICCFSIFDSEDDFCADDLAIVWLRDKGPHAVGFE